MFELVNITVGGCYLYVGTHHLVFPHAREAVESGVLNRMLGFALLVIGTYYALGAPGH